MYLLLVFEPIWNNLNDFSIKIELENKLCSQFEFDSPAAHLHSTQLPSFPITLGGDTVQKLTLLGGQVHVQSCLGGQVSGVP